MKSIIYLIYFFSDPRADPFEESFGGEEVPPRRPPQKSLQIRLQAHAQGVHLGLLELLPPVTAGSRVPHHGPEEKNPLWVAGFVDNGGFPEQNIGGWYPVPDQAGGRLHGLLADVEDEIRFENGHLFELARQKMRKIPGRNHRDDQPRPRNFSEKEKKTLTHLY